MNESVNLVDMYEICTGGVVLPLFLQNGAAVEYLCLCRVRLPMN